MAGKSKSSVSNILDRLAGDKVVWIIVLCLCMFSMVSIFSSTSLLALQTGTSRIEIAKDQLITIAVGLLFILGCYKIKSIGFYRWMSQWGFLFSLILLGLLVILSRSSISLPFVKAPQLNGAYRWLKIFGVQISVFEVVKVAMVLYLAWAIDHLKRDELKLLDALSEINHLGFLSEPFWKDAVYLFLPTILTTVLVLTGGTSSALFMAGILFLVMILGGVKFKHLLILGLFGGAVLLGCYGMYQVTKHNEHPAFERIGTAVSRLSDNSVDYTKIIRESETKDQEYYDALDKIRQPYGAKVAIKEGGLIGKGPGQSTQKYKVAVMYEDYMFSFIIEEYGLIGGIIVIILYISLLARASIIIRNCENLYAKMAVAGLSSLIVGQAMFHIVINSDVGILTGQTLPLISHGTSSFWCFSIAFGVILSISRMAARKIERQTAKAEPLFEVHESDEIKGGLDDLDAFENSDINETETWNTDQSEQS